MVQPAREQQPSGHDPVLSIRGDQKRVFLLNELKHVSCKYGQVFKIGCREDVKIGLRSRRKVAGRTGRGRKRAPYATVSELGGRVQVLRNNPRSVDSGIGGGIASLRYSSTSRYPRRYLYRKGVVHGNGTHTETRDQAEGARFDVGVASRLRARPLLAKKDNAQRSHHTAPVAEPAEGA
jgi:hypothetical protein